jgi:hypothetical protein
MVLIIRPSLPKLTPVKRRRQSPATAAAAARTAGPTNFLAPLEAFFIAMVVGDLILGLSLRTAFM